MITLVLLVVSADVQPEWVLRGSGAYVIDGKRVLLGVGVASKIKNQALLRTTAGNRARAELGKLGDTLASALVKRQWDAKKLKEGESVGAIIKPLSIATLTGADVIDNYQDGDVAYALARVSIDDVKTGIAGLDAMSQDAKKDIGAGVEPTHQALVTATDPCARPFIDDAGDVFFTYTGAAKTVRVVGDFTPTSATNYYWSEDGLPLTKLSEGCHMRVGHFEMDARLDYALVVDGKRVLDPKNKRTIFSGVAGGATVNELVMPEHPKPWAPDGKRKIKKGKLTPFAATTKVMVYTPPGYSSKKTYPVLYTADGSAWIEHLKLPALLDALIAEGAIEPIIAVMIDPTEARSAWYTQNPDFLAYVSKLVEDVEKKHPAGKRVHAGTSAGGRATVFLGLSRPDLFPNLGVLSAALDPQLAPAASDMDVWISAGTYEGAILDTARVLEKHFPKTVVTVTNEGHSFGAWRARLPAMLQYFFRPAS